MSHFQFFVVGSMCWKGCWWCFSLIFETSITHPNSTEYSNEKKNGCLGYIGYIGDEILPSLYSTIDKDPY